jgi:hypothetical protein
MFNYVPLHGHLTQAMALEDNILDIQSVSNQEQKRASNQGARLTLQ